MWELWAQMQDFNMYCVYSSNDLMQIRALEYEHALQGIFTEIRLNMEALR